MPSPDPSASLSAYQSWVVSTASWASPALDLLRLSVFALVVGLAFVVFVGATMAAATAFRR